MEREQTPRGALSPPSVRPDLCPHQERVVDDLASAVRPRLAVVHLQRRARDLLL